MTRNRATIYSNGIADFQRVFEVTKKSGRKISIPVRQQHLADILGSLTVSGDVTVDGPPSFEPANRDQSNIAIDRNDSLVSLATQLTGADVKLVSAGETIKGRLIGLDREQTATNGQPVSARYLVIQVKSQIRRMNVRDVESLEFIDADVQNEIDKALSRQLRSIKPNSTFVDLELSTTTTKTSAVVQYTIPAAAWKISYRIILHETGPVSIEGHAIVDNNTDEDWNDFIVSVVMGQPITFATDLAESKTPSREYVNIVQDSAIGNVDIERSLALLDSAVAADISLQSLAMESAPAPARQTLKQSRGRSPREYQREKAADTKTAEIDDAGDFCIFESATPVSITAHRSASIPVFSTTLDESTGVLHFRESNHSTRPYRAIRFKNTTGHSLSRGVCTVYIETTYAGTCVLPASKPDDVDLVPHALETGVRVVANQKPVNTRRTAIQISDGVAVESRHQVTTTTYQINSSSEESSTFVIDHAPRLGKSAEIECQLIRDGEEAELLDTSTISDGVRAEFLLNEKEVVSVSFVESTVRKSRVSLSGDSPDADRFLIPWLIENIVDSDLSVAGDAAVAKCVELQKLLDEKKDQMRHAGAEIERLAARQQRLRENIKAGGPDQVVGKWQNSLARSEDAIVQLEDERIPELEKAQRDLRMQLFDALNELTLDWSETA